MQLVIYKCLFELPSQSVDKALLPPKCKSQQTRAAAFNLASIFCKNPEFIQSMMQFLKSQFEDPSWRTSKRPDWNNSSTSMEKSITGYCGMKNLGCICYMISIMQQIYHIESFRNGILGAITPEDDPAENLLYQVKWIFAGLKYSDK